MNKVGITKRALIDQANSTVVIITSVAAFIVVFSLVATKTLISQSMYQNHVITAKKQALHQLQDDLKATDALKASYKTFQNADPNVLGGSATGTDAQDGNNADIVLHALPSTYDFPALATSLEKLVTSVDGLTINNIAGTDDEVAQSTNTTSATPTPVPIPFQLSVTGNYEAIQELVNNLEHSIRPFQVLSLDLSGDQSKLTLEITAQTYYQPAKVLNTKNTKVVK